MTPRPSAAVDHDVLAALTGLVARWSSAELQREVGAGVGLDLDLTAQRALYTLGLRGGAMRPSDLAAALHLTRPTASKMLARLEAAELIERRDDPDDGRAATVVFNHRGERVYGLLVDAGLAMIAEAFTGWDVADVRAFDALLRRFTDGLLVAADHQQAHLSEQTRSS